MFKLLLRNLRLAYQANRFYVSALIAVNAIYAALDLSSLFILAVLIDLFVSYLTKPSPGIIQASWWWFGALVVRWILANLCNQFLDYLNDVHKPQIVNFVDNVIIAKLNSLPTTTIESSDFQDRMTTIHTFGKIRFVENLNLVGTLVQAAAQCLYAVAAIMLNNPVIALLIILISIPEVRYNLTIIRKMRDLNERTALQRRRSSYYVSLTQDIAHYFNLKSYNLFPYFLDKIKQAQSTIQSGTRSVQRYHKPRSIAIGTVANLIGQFVPKGYYVWATLTKRISIGQFQLYYRLIDGAYNSSYQVYMTYLQMSENNIYVSDLFDLLDMTVPNPLPRTTIAVHAPASIQFRDVSFSYPGSKQAALTNISFTARPGEKLAIVGANGSGKTTITKLINKFYAPTSGLIQINGLDLQSLDDEQWRSLVSTMSQDVPKYYLSAKDNVLIGDYAHPTDNSRYRHSIEQAQVAKDISNLPDKDDNVLGTNFPKGVNLSGGQWQKLSIARSFYRQAPVLILDEPTSAVDSQTEQEIFTSIFANNTRQTQIIISHKFANIRQADQIIVLDQGHIVEMGNHHHLLARRGLYASLYKQQSAAFTD